MDSLPGMYALWYRLWGLLVLRYMNVFFSVFQNEVTKHTVKYNGIINNLCSDPCLSAFQYANKLDMSACDFCGTLCTSLESSPHMVQFEGLQKRFCSDSCVTKFRFNHRKVTPCSWCGSQRDNFDMIERLDSNNKYQLFCSLNCLSLYRVNLQVRRLVGQVFHRFSVTDGNFELSLDENIGCRVLLKRGGKKRL